MKGGYKKHISEKGKAKGADEEHKTEQEKACKTGKEHVRGTEMGNAPQKGKACRRGQQHTRKSKCLKT